MSCFATSTCRLRRWTRKVSGRPPHRKTVGIYFRAISQPTDGVSIIARLRPRVYLLAWLAVARAEVGVIVDQYGHASITEYFCISVETLFLHAGEPVSHHNSRRRAECVRRKVQPPPQRHAAMALELDVGPHH